MIPALPNGDSAPLFPVGLVLQGKPCLVVGGGPVAARKASALLSCRANVTVVAPSHSRELQALARDWRQDRKEPSGASWGLSVEKRPYRPGEAASYRLVIAATGVQEVDRTVFLDAEAAGVFVNCADDPEHCSVMLPAVLRDGPVVVAVATTGASPAMATWLRDRMAACLPEHAGQLAALIAQARQRLIGKGSTTTSVDWRSLLDGSLPALVATGRYDEAIELIERAARGSSGHDSTLPA
jgi:siroheme synthase-like protein